MSVMGLRDVGEVLVDGVVGLDFDGKTGVLSLTAGYAIPLAASYLLADGSIDLTADWTIATNSITLTAGTLTACNLKVYDGIFQIFSDTTGTTVADGFKISVEGTASAPPVRGNATINSQDGDLTILASGGNISFGDENLLTTGTLGAGAITGTTLRTSDEILATGTFGAGWTEPDTGAGTRMLWYPRKGAFRAGAVSGVQWDDANIGIGSVAFGTSGTAAGSYSTHFGLWGIAAGDYSLVAGRNMQLTQYADRTFAFGYSEDAVSIVQPDTFFLYGNTFQMCNATTGAAATDGLTISLSGDDATINNQDGNLNILAGGGDIGFGDENLLTTGTLGAGAITGTSLIVDTDTLVVDEVNHTVEPLIIELVTTTTSATGVIRKGANSFIHDFHHSTGDEAVPKGYNTFVGELAGNFTMGSTATEIYHGSKNSALGYVALRSNTTGYRNSAFGSYALYSNTTGSYNSALGYAALNANTSGYRNSAFGSEALYANTSGYRNLAFGSYALRFNTTGYNNSAVGYAALSSNTTGNYNSAMSYYALYSNTTGSYNSAVGNNALRSLKPTSGAITAFADYSETVAGTVMATSVGHELTGVSTKKITGTVNYNGSESITVIDADTFYFTATWVATEKGWWGVLSEAQYNTAVGYDSGYSLTTGSSNIFLGYGAGYNQTTASNLLIIDNQDRESAANEVTKSLIYGVFDADPANQTLRINAVLNVTENIQIDAVQVVGNRVIDARCDDAVNSGDATTDGVIDALRDAMITHGLIAAA